ncbi:hypothetical protein [Streptomyces sp. NBC_00564]|uniref:hypothetical protein n=1 Tax=unclassified Streptomyces TaxID=2593676 RepID=UPI00324F6BC5|nr:hypothetical protein OG256_04070 [Streptomyces sp. NBC_00564]
MHDAARSTKTRSTKKGIGRFREPGTELENLLRDALAVVAGTNAVSRTPSDHHRFRDVPRHRLARSAGHLFGYALLGYIVVHQRRSLKNPAA